MQTQASPASPPLWMNAAPAKTAGSYAPSIASPTLFELGANRSSPAHAFIHAHPARFYRAQSCVEEKAAVSERKRTAPRMRVVSHNSASAAQSSSVETLSPAEIAAMQKLTLSSGSVLSLDDDPPRVLNTLLAEYAELSSRHQAMKKQLLSAKVRRDTKKDGEGYEAPQFRLPTRNELLEGMRQSLFSMH
eukprot:CAMPEP_0174243444 /NCGR_PEP_ID=MMETSP0417-20130205/31662_1 /TAXON_ID=242541 /ORGANISM="Mayorella sp, Strain BSH-02190019" /LENGTH=189 /DNA_ID=CAMNT_0015322967 /DNA_START=141 /DNA_END=707 /DNA_ORIENTATION=+